MRILHIVPFVCGLTCLIGIGKFYEPDSTRSRALEIAIKYKTHVDTVIYFRNKYLRALEKQETSKRFIQYSQGVSDGKREKLITL